jgi:hypothetical protein
VTTIDALKELRSDFVRLAEAEEDSDTRTPSHRLSAHPRVYVTSALVACAAVVGAIVMTTSGGGGSTVAGSARHGVGQAHHGQVHGSIVTGQKTAGIRGLTGAWSAEHPLFHGDRVSLEAAQAALGVAIPLAQDHLTNQSQMGPITLATGGRVHGARDTFVAISYPKSQIAIEYETPVPYPDPVANYKAYVAEDQQAPLLHHLAFVGSVAGRPALLIRFHADATRTNPASVEFVFNNIKIAVIGYQSASALLRVADSIVQGSR